MTPPAVGAGNWGPGICGAQGAQRIDSAGGKTMQRIAVSCDCRGILEAMAMSETGAVRQADRAPNFAGRAGRESCGAGRWERHVRMHMQRSPSVRRKERPDQPFFSSRSNCTQMSH